MSPFNKNLLKKLGQPVFPYAGDTYNTLSSTVQNVALAAIAYYFVRAFFERQDMTLDMAMRFAIAFVIVVVIWHRYITHNHFAAWLPRSRDTWIIAVFAIIQYSVIFTAPDHSVYFAWALFVTSAWGIFSYSNTINSFKQPEVKILFLAHFEDRKLAISVLEFCQKFNHICMKQVCWVAVIYLFSAIIVSLRYSWPDSVEQCIPIKLETFVLLVATAGVGFILFFFDLRHYLVKDAAWINSLEEKNGPLPDE